MAKNKKNDNRNLNKHKQTYYVQGMHCSTCEILITQDVSAIQGVQEAKVSLSNSKVVITCTSAKDIPDVTQLDEMFKDLGYTFHNNKTETKLSKEDIFKVLGIGLLFIVAFFSLEKSGFFLKYSVTAQSSVFSYFIFGIAAGLSSCAALVGGLLLSLSKQWNEMYNNNKKQSVKPFLYFNFARIAAFTLLGGLLGFVGGLITVSITWTSVITFFIALLMLILGLQMVGVKWLQKFNFNLFGKSSHLSNNLDKNKQIQGKFVPVITGALTFFIPCGFTLIAQTNALNSGSFISGASNLLAFALGTLPILALISFSSVKFYSNPKFAKKFSLFSGTLIIFFALYTLNSQLNVLGYKSLNDIKLGSNDSKQVRVVDSNLDFQVLQMEASGFEYLPTHLTLQSGVKTEWQIYNSGALGCAGAVYARGLYPDVIQLKTGMNTVEFVAPAPGTYKISCSMGMVSPVTVTVY